MRCPLARIPTALHGLRGDRGSAANFSNAESAWLLAISVQFSMRSYSKCKAKWVAAKKPDCVHRILERRSFFVIIVGAFDFQQSIEHSVIGISQASRNLVRIDFPDRHHQRVLPNICRVFHSPSRSAAAGMKFIKNLRRAARIPLPKFR